MASGGAASGGAAALNQRLAPRPSAARTYADDLAAVQVRRAARRAACCSAAGGARVGCSMRLVLRWSRRQPGRQSLRRLLRVVSPARRCGECGICGAGNVASGPLAIARQCERGRRPATARQAGASHSLTATLKARALCVTLACRCLLGPTACGSSLQPKTCVLCGWLATALRASRVPLTGACFTVPFRLPFGLARRRWRGGRFSCSLRRR